MITLVQLKTRLFFDMEEEFEEIQYKKQDHLTQK